MLQHNNKMNLLWLLQPERRLLLLLNANAVQSYRSFKKLSL